MSRRLAPKMKEVAKRLLAHEAALERSPGATASGAGRVCAKLRAQLARLAGMAGFRSLLSRALALAWDDVSWLKAVKVEADGSLEGLESTELQLSKQEITRGEIILIAHLLDLLVTFIGAGLTLRLLRDAWPELSFPA